MIRTAILVDGGYYRKRALSQLRISVYHPLTHRNVVLII